MPSLGTLWRSGDVTKDSIKLRWSGIEFSYQAGGPGMVVRQYEIQYKKGINADW